jgi:hypothetical protein
MRASPLAAAGLLLLALSGDAVAEPKAAFLLFETPWLAGLPAGSTLIYRWERTVAAAAAGADAPGAGPSTSTIELSLLDDPAGARQARVAIVTGDQQQEAGPFPTLVGNPVLLVVLERDVAEMSRILRGSPYYLRNRVREALGESATAEPARVVTGGRAAEGWRITARPFAQDRNRDKLREYAGKRYEFTLSDAVPGGLVALRMVTPSADGTPLAEDHLAFDRVQAPRGEGR